MIYKLEEISIQNDYLMQKKWIRMWAELCFVTSNAMHIGPLLLHRLEQQQMKEIVHTMYTV